MRVARRGLIMFALSLTAWTANAQNEPKPPVEDGESSDAPVREAIIEQTSTGEAVTETAAPGWHYPKAYGARPLAMNKYMIRGTFILDVKRAAYDSSTGTGISTKPLVAIDLGLAFSPLENLEVGVSNYRVASTGTTAGQSMFPIVVSPIGAFGDMPVYLRYSFLRKAYAEIGFDFVFHIPSWTNLAVTFGLPVRLRVMDELTIDTGTEAVILSNGAGMNVEVPLKLVYNPTPAGFVFLDTGFSFQNLARNLTGGSFRDSNLAFPVDRNQVFVPLGVGGGYTHVIRDIVMVDVFARFGWNPFVYVNPPADQGTIPAADSWVLSVGVIIHTSPVLHE